MSDEPKPKQKPGPKPGSKRTTLTEVVLLRVTPELKAKIQMKGQTWARKVLGKAT